MAEKVASVALFPLADAERLRPITSQCPSRKIGSAFVPKRPQTSHIPQRHGSSPRQTFQTLAQTTRILHLREKDKRAELSETFRKALRDPSTKATRSMLEQTRTPEQFVASSVYPHSIEGSPSGSDEEGGPGEMEKEAIRSLLTEHGRTYVVPTLVSDRSERCDWLQQTSWLITRPSLLPSQEEKGKAKKRKKKQEGNVMFEFVPVEGVDALPEIHSEANGRRDSGSLEEGRQTPLFPTEEALSRHYAKRVNILKREIPIFTKHTRTVDTDGEGYEQALHERVATQPWLCSETWRNFKNCQKCNSLANLGDDCLLGLFFSGVRICPC